MAAFSSSPAFLAHQLPKPRLSLSLPSRPSPPPPNHFTVQSPVPPSAKPQQTAAHSTNLGASNLTRRLSLTAGLALVAFPAIGAVPQQAEISLESSRREANRKVSEKEVEVVLPNGIRYYDMKVGGGASPQPGDLVVMDLRGRVHDSSASGQEELVNTFGEGKRSLALVMDSGRPYGRGMCEGIEQALTSMRAGGRRRVVVPPGLGFGEKGADLGSGLCVPPDATLEFVVQLVDNISVAPSSS